MKKVLFLLLFLGLPACPLIGQTPVYKNVVFVDTAPSGACTNGEPARITITLGALYTCQNGTWGTIGVGSTITSSQHYIATGHPTIVCGPGAGTSPSVCFIEGNDEIGQIAITTGSSPANAGLIATITIQNTCPTKVYALIRGSNQNAATLTGNTHDYPDGFTAGTWTITANATGLSANTAYTWAYNAGCN